MDQRGQWITLSLMIAVAAFVIASDVFLATRYGTHATYSGFLARLYDQYPVILVVSIFAVGVLVGHVLMPVYPR